MASCSTNIVPSSSSSTPDEVDPTANSSSDPIATVPKMDDPNLPTDLTVNSSSDSIATAPQLQDTIDAPIKMDAPNLLTNFPRWNELPLEIRDKLAQYQHAGLQSEYGALVYCFGSDHKRYMMLIDTLQSLIQETTSDPVQALGNFLAHKLQLLAWPHGDNHSHAWCVSDEETNSHRVVTEAGAKKELKMHLRTLISLVEDNFLVGGNIRKTRNRILQFKGFLSEMQDEPAAEPLKQKLHFYEKAVELVTAFGKAGCATIVRSFMDSCKQDATTRQVSLIADDTWLPCPDKDVNVITGATRRRWLPFNMIGQAATNFTVPSDLACKPLSQWNEQERLEHFGPMKKIFDKISADQEEIHRDIVISLYLQLLGHNYLIFWTGPEEKSSLLALFHQVLGPLAKRIDKSVLFRTKEKGKPCSSSGTHAGTIDGITDEDELVSSASPFTGALLMCCKGEALPKFQRKEDLPNVRVVRFPAYPLEEEAAASSSTQGDPSLAALVVQDRVPEQFLNFIILQGGQYYQQNMALHREPLIPPAECDLAPAQMETPAPAVSKHESFKEWFSRRTMIDPSSQVRLVELATVYCQDNRTEFKQPEPAFYVRLQRDLPDVVRSCCSVANSPGLVLTGYRLI